MANRILRNPARTDGRYLVEIYRDEVGNDKLRVVEGQGIHTYNLRFSREERAKYKPGDKFYLTIVESPNVLYYMSTDPILTRIGDETSDEFDAIKTFDAVIDPAKFTFLCDIVKEGRYPFLIGPKGCGKSTIAKALAKYLNYDYFEFDMGQAIKPKKYFIGGVMLSAGATEIVQSEFLKAYTSERPTLIFLDELTRIPDQAANFLMTILSRNQSFIYDEDSGTRYFKGDNVRLITAGNIGSQYVSTSQLDSAFEDRFIKIKLDHLTPDQETNLILATYPKIPRATAQTLTKASALLRKAEKEGELLQTCSTRQVMDAALFLNKGYDLKFVIQNIIVPNYISSGEEEVASKMLASF